MQRYWEYKGLFDEAEDLYEGVKNEIKGTLGDAIGVEIPGSRVYFKPVVSNRIDVAKLRQKYPEAAKECEAPSISRPLKVYAI